MTLTTFPAQSSSVPVSVSLKVSQLAPSTQLVSLADAPPVTGPCQTTFGPLGPIDPLGGFDASAGQTGKVSNEIKQRLKTNDVKASFLIVDRDTCRVFMYRPPLGDVGIAEGNLCIAEDGGYSSTSAVRVGCKKMVTLG